MLDIVTPAREPTVQQTVPIRQNSAKRTEDKWNNTNQQHITLLRISQILPLRFLP